MVFTKGEDRMNLALHMTKKQLVLLTLLIIALIATSLIVVHAAVPGLWRTVVDTPAIPYWKP